MIHPFLQSHLPLVIELFKKHKITSAYAFGSVVTDKFNDESDVDFIINFDEGLDPLERGELWWDLYYSIKDNIHREIDLITEKSLDNPYFIKELNATKVKIYG